MWVSFELSSEIGISYLKNNIILALRSYTINSKMGLEPFCRLGDYVYRDVFRREGAVIRETLRRKCSGKVDKDFL